MGFAVGAAPPEGSRSGMDFGYSEDQRVIQRTARELLSAPLAARAEAPLVAHLDLANLYAAYGRELGFSRVVLDTIAEKMPEAVALYASMGFHPIPPYSGTPGALCMELLLR